MGLRCKRCGSEEHVKNGLMRGHQRYLCKSCGLNFTDTPARGKPLALKTAAVLLYVSGLSMNRTAKVLGVSTPTIQAWLEQFAAALCRGLRGLWRAVAGWASLYGQGGDARHRAGKRASAALARPLPAALHRGLQGQAHGGCQYRTLRPLRWKQQDRRPHI